MFAIIYCISETSYFIFQYNTSISNISRCLDGSQNQIDQRLHLAFPKNRHNRAAVDNSDPLPFKLRITPFRPISLCDEKRQPGVAGSKFQTDCKLFSVNQLPKYSCCERKAAQRRFAHVFVIPLPVRPRRLKIFELTIRNRSHMFIDFVYPERPYGCSAVSA